MAEQPQPLLIDVFEKKLAAKDLSKKHCRLFLHQEHTAKFHNIIHEGDNFHFDAIDQNGKTWKFLFEVKSGKGIIRKEWSKFSETLSTNSLLRVKWDPNRGVVMLLVEELLQEAVAHGESSISIPGGAKAVAYGESSIFIHDDVKAETESSVFIPDGVKVVAISHKDNITCEFDQLSDKKNLYFAEIYVDILNMSEDNFYKFETRESATSITISNCKVLLVGNNICSVSPQLLKMFSKDLLLKYSIVIVAKDIGKKALGTLASYFLGCHNTVAALTGSGEHKCLDDVAAVTGATVIEHDLGPTSNTPDRVLFGHASAIHISQTCVTLCNKDVTQAVEDQIASLKQRLANLSVGQVVLQASG